MKEYESIIKVKENKKYSSEKEKLEKKLEKHEKYERKQTYAELQKSEEKVDSLEDVLERERCANIQILELFKVINYLTNAIPNGKQLLKRYYNPVDDKDDNGNIICSFNNTNHKYDKKRIIRDFDVSSEDERNDDDVNLTQGTSAQKTIERKSNNIDNRSDNAISSDDESEKDTKNVSKTCTTSRRESVSPVAIRRAKLPRKSSQKRDAFAERYPKRERKSRVDEENDDEHNEYEDEDDSDDDALYTNRKSRDPILEKYGRGKRKAWSGRSYAEGKNALKLRSSSISNYSSDNSSERQSKSNEKYEKNKQLPASSVTSRARSPSPKPKQTNRSSSSSADERTDKIIGKKRTHSPASKQKPTKRSNSNSSSNDERAERTSTKVIAKKKARSPSPQPVKKRSPSPLPPPRRGGKRKKEEIGHFPCDFDQTQCKEVLTTRENYDFHMTGHIHAKFICPFCAYTGPTIQIIKRHINFERDGGDKEGGPAALEKAKVHETIKVYQCTACTKCHKIHERDEKRCEHIQKSDKRKCNWGHDIDHEFKDHLKEHIDKTFSTKMSADTRKQKIKEILNKFVDDTYFANTAKKRIMLSKFKITKPVGMESDDE